MGCVTCKSCLKAGYRHPLFIKCVTTQDLLVILLRYSIETQIDLRPFMTRTEIVDVCKGHGIILEVHSFFWSRGTYRRDTHALVGVGCHCAKDAFRSPIDCRSREEVQERTCPHFSPIFVAEGVPFADVYTLTPFHDGVLCVGLCSTRETRRPCPNRLEFGRVRV